MEDIQGAGVCPFCTENLHKYHKKSIIKQGDFWLLTENQWPYENTRRHLLAIARQHVEMLAQLPKGSGDELVELFAWASKQFAIKAGGLAMRFGSMESTGATVSHLHAHLIEPLPDLPSDQKVRFKIS